MLLFYKPVSIILSEIYSQRQTNRAVMPQNDAIVATASDTTQRTPAMVEPAGVRRLSFTSPLLEVCFYEASAEEILEKQECIQKIDDNKNARKEEVAYFHDHGYWPEDVKATV